MTMADIKRSPTADLDHYIAERLRADDLQAPPYPAIAAKVQRLVDTDGYASMEVAELVRSDAALTALLLRHASSAAQGASRPVESIETAVVRLGAREVARLAF